jgi:uncharacterized Zn finger protein (UPF0148 family)
MRASPLLPGVTGTGPVCAHCGGPLDNCRAGAVCCCVKCRVYHHRATVKARAAAAQAASQAKVARAKASRVRAGACKVKGKATHTLKPTGRTKGRAGRRQRVKALAPAKKVAYKRNR